MMEARLIDRIFEEIDHNAKQIESLAALVHGLSSSVGLMNKIIVGLFLAVFCMFITQILSPENKTPNLDTSLEKHEKQHDEVIKKYKELLKQNDS